MGKRIIVKSDDNIKELFVLYTYSATYFKSGEFVIEKTPQYAYVLNDRIMLYGYGLKDSLLIDHPESPLTMEIEDDSISLSYTTFDNNSMEDFKNKVIERLMHKFLKGGK